MRIPAFIAPVLIAPVLAALLLTGCASSVPAEPAGGGGSGGPGGPASTPPTTPPTDPTPPPVDPSELRGNWVATELSPAALVPGKEPRLTLQKDLIGVRPGCNSMGGSYAVEGTQLKTDRLTSTMMGCVEELMQQERAVSALLRADPQWTLVGDELTLIADGTRMVLVRDTSPPDPGRAPTEPVGPTLTPAPGQQ